MTVKLVLKHLGKALPPKAASREAHALLSAVLMENGLPASPLLKDENGRPYVPHGSTAFDFNLSHAGAYAVCALAVSEAGDVAPPRVGVDVEVPNARISKEGIAARFFSPAECDRLQDAGYDDDAFLSVWTKKEAYLKYVGTGLSGGLRETDTENADTLRASVTLATYALCDSSACVSICLPRGVTPPASVEIRD